MMSLLLSLMLGCPGVGSNWWSEPEPTSTASAYFQPTEWAFEAWGYYDGDTLGEFRYYGNNSGSVPAFMAIYLLGPGLSCTWVGAMQVEGGASLDDEQWEAFVVSLSMTETDCDELDPGVWGASNPSAVLDGLYLALGWKDLTPSLDERIQEVLGSEGWTYEQEYEDHAFTQMLGIYDPDSDTWEVNDVGPAFTFLADEDGVLDVTVGEIKKLPRTEELQSGVVFGYTLDPRPISEITPF